MRRNVERNGNGQFKKTEPIRKYAALITEEYFKKFPDVDIWDLIVILEMQLHHQASMTILKEDN